MSILQTAARLCLALGCALLLATPLVTRAGDAKTDAILSSIMSETAAYSLKTLERLTAKQRAELEKGEAVIIGGPIKDSQGRSLEDGKRADTYVVLDLPPQITFAVLTDLNHYKAIFDDVSVSTVLHSRNEGGEKLDFYHQVVALPGVSDPVSTMLIHSKAGDADGDGSPDQWAIWWHRDDTYTAKNADGEEATPNLIINSGAWKILPWDGGKKSLVFYSLIQVPDFYVPDLLWEKATTWLGIPKLLKEVTKAGQSGRYK